MVEMIRRYTGFLSALDMISRRKLVLLSPRTWVDQNDTAFIEAYCTRRKLGQISALCLAEAAETFHHWQIFAGREAGVCVVFRGDAFRAWAALQPNVLARSVAYKTLNELRAERQIETEDLPFLKRSGFEAEREFRLISTAKPQKGSLTVEFDLDLKLIDRLTFSPFIHRSLFESAKAVVQSLPGCAKLRCSHSQLINNRQWREMAETKGA